MTAHLKVLLAQVLELPKAERVELLGEVLDSLSSPEEVEAAWTIEIRRRLAELQTGKTRSIPWREALQAAEGKVKRHGRRVRQ